MSEQRVFPVPVPLPPEVGEHSDQHKQGLVPRLFPVFPAFPAELTRVGNGEQKADYAMFSLRSPSPRRHPGKTTPPRTFTRPRKGFTMPFTRPILAKTSRGSLTPHAPMKNTRSRLHAKVHALHAP